MRQTIKDAEIDEKVLLNHKVERMSWANKEWTLHVRSNGAPRRMSSKFIFLATGYYDYDEPLQTVIPNIDSFRGQVVHPQFWPEHLDYTDKTIAIVGSGATAITLLPSLAKTAKHVTMLQRSPSYIKSVPNCRSKLESLIRATCPRTVANKIIRFKWIVLPTLFRTWCLLFPSRARRHMHKLTQAELGSQPVDQNFTPTYNPFEQRMCLSPDGDFYQCLRDGRGSVKTGIIDAVTPDSIKLKSGDELHPDIIVTATGLKLRIGGGIDIDIDGEPFHINQHYVWKGIMFEGMPNCAFSLGYFDAAWTLGVDMSAQLACRILKQMRRDGTDAVVAERSQRDKEQMNDIKFMPLSSTYVQKALSSLPKLGDRAPWRPRSTYLWELFAVRWGDIRTGLRWMTL